MTDETKNPFGIVKTEAEAQAVLQKAQNLFQQRQHQDCLDACIAILNGFPEMLEAHFLFAINAYVTQNWKPAAQGFEFILSKEPTHGPSYAYLAHIYTELDMVEEADKCIEAIEAAKVADPEANHLLSSAYYSKAMKLVQKGDFKEAVEPLKALLKLNPKSGQPHWLLSDIMNIEDDTHIKAMKKLLDEGVGDHDQVFLQYAIGKELEELKDFDNAFAAYDAGAKAKRKLLTYSDKQDSIITQALTEAFNKNTFNGNGDESVSPIFIIGMPRSGSTLIERIISTHSAVSSIGEQWHATNIVNGSVTANPESDLEATIMGLKGINVDEFAAQYLELARQHPNFSSRFTDKFPHNYRFLPLLAAAFPRAKFVHVYKDARDACVSNFKYLFGNSSLHSYDQVELANHYCRYQSMMKTWEEACASRIIDVPYENFVKNFENETKRLIAELDLRWEKDCLKYFESESPVTTASATQVREAPHERAIGRWKEYEKHIEPMLDILAQVKV